MKAQIHPQYFENAQVICVCGNKFTVGSTQEVIHVELCNNCHPFYTGEQKFVDSASRIQKFQNKQKTAEEYISKKIKKQQELKKKEEGPKTLREMLSSLS
ncbi:MAG: 50S ribosomal protein L31 [Candidatus Levybacteria bacterium]|nr:50S ribosomal protein L31 [Candidatus Levybacteria bacterium]